MSNYDRYLEFCATNGIQRGALEKGFNQEAEIYANPRGPGNKRATTPEQWRMIQKKRETEKAKRKALAALR